MSDQNIDKLQKKEKKTGKLPADGSHGTRGKETVKTKDTVSYTEDLGQHEDATQRTVTLENTYQLGPNKPFPVTAASDILKDVLTNHLQEENYEVQRARELTLTLCAIIRSRVKELMVPRYKIVVLIHIGQLNGQSMQVSSRFLWDASNDTFASYSFKNRSLFCVAIVYAVYFE
ncbi:dynein light chain Tctex-type 5 [Melanotaenia boesemani]|uniref:dynein light chain Tctex-type 5 n=1 Tax=Melanotaenia boesemani TaxID=1250792 RepID=UPI001C056DA7|nr:dynein light chain Tctex-type 5 [Melanotaenia boesemani]